MNDKETERQRERERIHAGKRYIQYIGNADKAANIYAMATQKINSKLLEVDEVT